MSDQVLFLGLLFPLVVFFVVGFGALYWLTKSGKYTKSNALEDVKKQTASLEKPWLMPLFMVFAVISAGAIAQDILALVTHASIVAPPWIKYLYALCFGAFYFIGVLVVRRKQKDLLR